MFKKPLIWLALCLVAASGYVAWSKHVVRSQSTVTATNLTIPACPDLSGNHLNWTSGAMSCGTSSSSTSYLSGTTGSIGGSLLIVGASASGAATVTGATIGMPCVATPSDGTNMAGLGADIICTVTSSSTATVNVLAIISLTPASKTYNVRVYP
jgi:hypothetical protein